MSATARKRKEELAQALKKLIQSKGKTPALRYQQLFDDLRAQSETVCFIFAFLKTCNARPMLLTLTRSKACLSPPSIHLLEFFRCGG